MTIPAGVLGITSLGVAQVDLPGFAENFFDYGFQNYHKRFYRDEVEALVSNLVQCERAAMKCAVP